MSSRARIAGAALVLAGACAHAPGPSSASSRPVSPELSVAQLLEVARAAERLGDGLRAQQYLRAAAQAGASPERTLPWLLRLYIADGQYRLAITTAQELLRAHPAQTQLRFLLAGLYEATQLEAAAIEEYEHVLAAAPDQAQAHFALAALLRECAREPGRADAHFRAYLALAPQGEQAELARTYLMKELP